MKLRYNRAYPKVIYTTESGQEFNAVEKMLQNGDRSSYQKIMSKISEILQIKFIIFFGSILHITNFCVLIYSASYCLFNNCAFGGFSALVPFFAILSAILFCFSFCFVVFLNGWFISELYRWLFFYSGVVFNLMSMSISYAIIYFYPIIAGNFT